MKTSRKARRQIVRVLNHSVDSLRTLRLADMSDDDRDAKADHDSLETRGWPAVRRPRFVQPCIHNQWLDMQRSKARSFRSATQAARAMGISRRRAAALRAK